MQYCIRSLSFLPGWPPACLLDVYSSLPSKTLTSLSFWKKRRRTISTQRSNHPYSNLATANHVMGYNVRNWPYFFNNETTFLPVRVCLERFLHCHSMLGNMPYGHYAVSWACTESRRSVRIVFHARDSLEMGIDFLAIDGVIWDIDYLDGGPMCHRK